MRKLKLQVLKYFNYLITHSEIFDKIEVLERKLNRVTQMNHLFTPEILPIESKAEKIFSEVNGIEVYKKADLRISKNDLMFLFWVYQTQSVDLSLSGYFKSGLDQADLIRKLIARELKQVSSPTILDFASGHGRVSRYFKNFLEEQSITISDIKTDAVDFQVNFFGYNGFVAPADPSDFNTTKKFDLVIVSSLFTHLNETLFKKWINALGKLVNDTGILSISIHANTEDLKDKFVYKENSEEDLFPETADSLQGKKIYGLTHLSTQLFYQILDTHVGFNYRKVSELQWGDSQQLVSIQKLKYYQ